MIVTKLIEYIFGSRWGIIPFLCCLGYLGYILRHYARQVRLAWRLPGPKTLPLIGNVLIMSNKNLLFQESKNCIIKYGPLIRIWVSMIPIFVPIEPEHVQLVLSSQKHTDKIFVYRFLHNFLGKGLITSSGKEWSQHRKYLQPSFHMSILEKFIETFADASQGFLNRIEKRCNVPTNITEMVNDCILDILNESVFGISIKNRQIKSEKDSSPYRQGSVHLPYRLSKPWLMFDRLYHLTAAASNEINQKSKLDSFTQNMVEQRRKIRKQGLTTRPCLLDHMLDIAEKHPDFTEEDITNEANTFMLAGQDSVGASVAFTLFLLAKHQEHQQKCWEEIEEIFQGDQERVPTMNDLRQMKYLEQCIKESLRMYPSVPILARSISEDIQMGDHVVPKHSLIICNIYATHHLAHIYPEPEKFQPDRFTAENSEKRNPYAFIPFAAGPRLCLGYKYAYLEMKTIISRILRSYTMQTVAGKDEIKPSFRITLRAQGGLWIRFQKRTGSE